MQSRLPVHLLAVFLGGMVGAGLRLGLDTLLPHSDSQFPVSTLVINVAGSFVLGLLTSGLWTTGLSSVFKAALGPGLLGSFTTFSAVVLALVLLTDARPPQLGVAVAYLVATVALGFGGALAGLALGPRTLRGRGFSGRGFSARGCSGRASSTGDFSAGEGSSKPEARR